MEINRTSFAVCLVAAAWSATATRAWADLINWDIDPAQSFVRLTIADQTVNVPGTGNVGIKLRNADDSAWSDAGGRRAFLDGAIQTNYVDASTIEFLSGAHDIFALEGVNLRPDPAQFTGLPDGDNPDGTYVGTGTAPAAYGAKVRGTISIITVDAAYIALRDVLYDISSGIIPLGGGTTIAGSTSNFGITSATIDVDGLSSIAGQPIPDVLNGSLTNITGLETAAGSVTNTGGLLRKLTYNVAVPIQIEIEGITLNGTANGQVVAFGTAPNNRVAAGNIVVAGVTDPGDNSVGAVTVPQTGSPALGSPAVSVSRANEGDYQIAVGGTGLNFADGVLLASVRQNIRDGLRASVEVGRSSFGDGIMSLSTTQAGFNGANEVNVDTAVAWFPFDGGWRGAHVEAGTGALLAANGVGIGMIGQVTPGTGRYTLDLGVDSHDEGMLFAVGGSNEDNVVNTGVLADHSGWDIRVNDNAVNFSANGEDDNFAFVYIPYATEGLIGGRYDGASDTHFKSVGSFTMAKLGAGQYKLTIAGESPETGMLILTTSFETTSGGVTAPDDNVLTYESDGLDSFLINSYDLPNIGFQNTQFVWAFIDFANPIADPPLPITADVNFDGVVNIFDINLISAHWDETGPTSDANHDGIVNIFDINLASSNWNAGGATAVPEPATFALLAMAGMALGVRRRVVAGR